MSMLKKKRHRQAALLFALGKDYRLLNTAKALRGYRAEPVSTF